MSWRWNELLIRSIDLCESHLRRLLLKTSEIWHTFSCQFERFRTVIIARSRLGFVFFYTINSVVIWFSPIRFFPDFGRLFIDINSIVRNFILETKACLKSLVLGIINISTIFFWFLSIRIDSLDVTSYLKQTLSVFKVSIWRYFLPIFFLFFHNWVCKCDFWLLIEMSSRLVTFQKHFIPFVNHIVFPRGWLWPMNFAM